MSTRGAYGFKINKEIKIIMSAYDSYPEGLGVDLINFLKSVELKRLTEKVQKLQAIPKSLIKENVLADKEIWKDPSQVLKAIYTGTLQSFFDAQDFLQDPLFCEYAYIINLDDKTLDCYEAGKFLSLGNYPLATLNKKTIEVIKKNMKNNAASKAKLLGFPP